MQPDALSQTFAALADPTRRAILKRPSAGPANVKELSRPFDMSGRAASKHLRVLERAGPVRAVATVPEPELAGSPPTARHRKLAAIGWTQTAARLVAYLERRTPWDS